MDQVLVPTGIKPPIETGPGSIVGTLVFDPPSATYLGFPPFPPTLLELIRNGAPFSSDTLPPGETSIAFMNLPPGEYVVAGRSSAFPLTSLPPVRVVEGQVNIGDFVLKILPSITGRVVFDRTQAPDLDQAPYPNTVVALLDSGTVILSEVLSDQNRQFYFTLLDPGLYEVWATADFFDTAKVQIQATSDLIDLGEVEIPIDGSDNPSEVHILYDETLPPRTILPGNVRDTTGQMQAERLGLWTFPQPFSQPPVLSPGVHRMRFILNRARANPVNWAAASMDTIDAPFTHEPAERIEGLGRDFWIRVATPTQFAVTLDLRRRTISLSALPTPLTAANGSRSTKP